MVSSAGGNYDTMHTNVMEWWYLANPDLVTHPFPIHSYMEKAEETMRGIIRRNASMSVNNVYSLRPLHHIYAHVFPPWTFLRVSRCPLVPLTHDTGPLLQLTPGKSTAWEASDGIHAGSFNDGSSRTAFQSGSSLPLSVRRALRRLH